MKFLLDENADARLATYLERLGHDVTSVARGYTPGASDASLLSLAEAEQRILITNDRDFGELVFHQRHTHTGVILFRLRSVSLASKIAALDRTLTQHTEELDQFLVVTERGVRIRRGS